jgi:hypothetical protein
MGIHVADARFLNRELKSMQLTLDVLLALDLQASTQCRARLPTVGLTPCRVRGHGADLHAGDLVPQPLVPHLDCACDTHDEHKPSEVRRSISDQYDLLGHSSSSGVDHAAGGSGVSMSNTRVN